MPGRFVVLTAVFTLLSVAVSRPAQAQWALPWCFTMAPFTDVFVMYAKVFGGGQRGGPGRDLIGNRALSVSIFQSGGILHVGGTILPKLGYVPVFFGGTIDPGTGTGTGQCFAPTLADCGNFTFQRITCPAATASVATMQALTPSGLAMGQVMAAE